MTQFLANKATTCFNGLWVGLLVFMTLSTAGATKNQISDGMNDKVSSLLMQSVFIKNSGQHAPECLYYSKTQTGFLYLLNDGEIVYSNHGKNLDFGSPNLMREVISHKRSMILKEGAPSPIIVSHFSSNVKQASSISSETFQHVLYEQIADGVSLELTSQGSTIEKQFYLSPGAKVSDITLTIENAELAVNSSGELIISSEEASLNYSKPTAYQIINDKARIVDIAYHVESNRYGFTVGDYDKSLPLTIDPLLGGTYYGNIINTRAQAMDIDQAGNIFITGSMELVPGDEDVFIAKFNNDLTQLLGEGFLAGNFRDRATDIAINQNGEVYLTGLTISPGFPATPGVFQQTKNDSTDLFIAKIDNQLTTNLATTFYGGSWTDGSLYAVIDIASNGDIYIGSGVRSPDIPMAGSPYQLAKPGYESGLIARFNSSLTTLIASTYLGGMYSEGLHALHIDDFGNIIVAGHTWSPDFPHTSGSFAGQAEAYISKLNSGLSSLEASMLLGGGASVPGSLTWEGGLDIASDNMGNIYLAGRTMANDFQPITPGVFQPTFMGAMDAFITKFNPSLTMLRSTFFGGTDLEVNHESFSIAVSDNFVWVAGATKSTESEMFPIVSSCYSTTNKGKWEGFISKLDLNLTSLYASTFFGGAEDDFIEDIKIDQNGHIFVCGKTSSTDLPTTANAFSSALSGQIDAFIAKFDTTLSKGNLGVEDLQQDFLTAVTLKASPNPASDYSMIEFSIPDDCFGELLLTDLNGRLLKTIINSPLKKNIYTYKVSLNDTKIASQYLLVNLHTQYKGKTHIKTVKLVVL